MRRGLLIVAGSLAALAVATLSAGAAATAARTAATTAMGATARVSPSTGGPHTRFTLSVGGPAAARPAGLRVRYAAIVVGPRHRGCQASTTVWLYPGAYGAAARVTLRTVVRGGWCTGTFRGQVVRYAALLCGPPVECPQLAIAPQTIARFQFAVKTS